MIPAGRAAPVDRGAERVQRSNDLAATPTSAWPSPTVNVGDLGDRGERATGDPRDDRAREQRDAERLFRNVLLQPTRLIEVVPHVDEPGPFGGPISRVRFSRRNLWASHHGLGVRPAHRRGPRRKVRRSTGAEPCWRRKAAEKASTFVGLGTKRLEAGQAPRSVLGSSVTSAETCHGGATGVDTRGLPGVRQREEMAHRSSGRSPVCFAIRASILGPISSPS